MIVTRINAGNVYEVQTSNILHLFSIFLLICSYYVTDMNKKLEFGLLLVLILLKIKFVQQAKISLPKSE